MIEITTPERGPVNLLEELIAEQRGLTPVEAFSRAHDRGEITRDYRSLIPLSAPLPGQQYAFEVKLDQCSGCKACVAACHAMNGLDEGEAWREVGSLVSHDWRRPFRQTVPTSCHHCVDPACLNGCPVLAYEKDEVTGIVKHLDDQCIGCQYCVMMCPYDVPKYSAERGIVRKCDMCSQRLEASEAPACVQACPNEAIRITVVEQASFVITLRDSGAQDQNVFLPAAPDPATTAPTTRFVSKTPLPENLFAGDAAMIQAQPAHLPLVWMLVLTQLGVGATLAAAFVSSMARNWMLTFGLAGTLAGLAASVLHLGRPSKAWRSFLGLRTSWLSREIVAFGSFAATLVCTTAAAPWLGEGAATASIAISAAIGLVGVFCSAFVYEATQRVFWSRGRSVLRFFGTTAVLGAAAAWAGAALNGVSPFWPPIFAATALMFKIALEQRLLRYGDDADPEELPPNGRSFGAWSLARSAVVTRQRFGFLMRIRFALAIGGGIVPALLSALLPQAQVFLAVGCFVSCFAGELAERSLFFRAVVPPRMPGGA